MLTRDDIIEHLKTLGAELEKRGMTGEFLLAGGAVMCLVHGARDATKDIDALYEPKTIINELAVALARQNGLDENWLNDSVKGFVRSNAPSETYAEFPGIKINTVSADYLLAMKLMSARYGETDAADIRFLMDKLSINSYEHAEAILLRYYAENEILPKTRYVIEEYLDGSLCAK